MPNRSSNRCTRVRSVPKHASASGTRSHIIYIAYEYSESEDLELDQGILNEIKGSEGAQDGPSDDEEIDDDSGDDDSDRDQDIGEMAEDWNSDDEASW